MYHEELRLLFFGSPQTDLDIHERVRSVTLLHKKKDVFDLLLDLSVSRLRRVSLYFFWFSLGF
jgi:hypothetical protein